MNQPVYLTEEEIKELNQLWKDYHGQSSGSGRQRHEWVSILLLNHTVYDCKHCGTHKDKAKSDFCDDEPTK